MEYTEPIPDYGDMITVREFIDCCKSNSFIDYDGFGHPAKGDKMMRKYIWPSKLSEIPKDATHIIWFNK